MRGVNWVSVLIGVVLGMFIVPRVMSAVKR